MPAWPTPVSSERPYLGVSFSPVSADAGSGQPAGARIGRVVAGGPAEEAGLHVGDVIFRADGQNLSPDRSLNDAVKAHQPGEVIVLDIWREGKDLAVSVKLGMAYEFTFSLSPIQHELKRIGLSLLEVTNGLVVEKIVAGSPAHDAGLMVGDLVVAINGQADLSSEALVTLLEEATAARAVEFTVERDNVRRQITVSVGSGPRP